MNDKQVSADVPHKVEGGLYFSVTEEEKVSIHEFVHAPSSDAHVVTSDSDSILLLKPNASFHEAQKLCASLSIHKFNSMAQTAPQSLQLLLESLTSFIEDKTDQVVTSMNQLKSMISSDAQAITIISYLDCVATSLSLYSFITDISRQAKQFYITIKPIREEQFAPAVMIAHEFFVKLLNGHKEFSLASDRETTATANIQPSAPPRGARGHSKKETNKELLDLKSKRSFNAMLEKLLPSFTYFFTTLRHLTYACFPTGKIAYLLIEISFAILKIDQLQMQKFGVQLHKHYPSLLSLYHAAILLLRIFYKHSDTYREQCNTLFVESLHHISSTKSTWKPFLMDENSLLQQLHPSSTSEKDEINSQHNTRVTSVTYALLTCLQCMGEDAHTVEHNDRAYYSAMKGLITDLLQRCCDKDLSDDYFATLSFLVQDILQACKSIFHPVSVLFLQLLSLSICMDLQMKKNENNNSNNKRNIPSINQLLDVVGSIAEGLTKFHIDWETRPLPERLTHDSKIVFTQLQSHIIQQLTSKWTLSHPNYMDLILQNDNHAMDDTNNDGYWLHDYSSVSDMPTATAKNNNSHSNISFIVFLDIMFEINNDVNEIVFEAQSMSAFNESTINREFLQKQLMDGCVAMTMAVVTHLTETLYPSFQRMLSHVTEADVRHMKIFRLYIQKVGWAAIANIDNFTIHTNNNNSTNNAHIADERCRDTCVALCHAWQKTHVHHLSSSISTANDQQLQALLHKLLHPSHQKHLSTVSHFAINNLVFPQQTAYNPVSTSSLPGFLSSISYKPELLSVIQETHMLLFNPQARSLVYKLVEQLLHFLHDPSPIIRARILKQLTRIAAIDTYILSWKKVKLSLEQTLQDRAISVREESVKLVANYILQKQDSPSSESYYLSQLIPLMHDEGISVRKSVLSVLRDTLLTYPFHAQYREICVALLARVAATQEEDSIKEFIGHIFQQLWFLPPSQEVCETLVTVIYNNNNFTNINNNIDDKDNNTNNNTNNVAARKIHFIKHFHNAATHNNANNSLNKKDLLKEMSAMHVRFTALQLIELLQFHDESRTCILSLLQSLLHGQAAGNEKHDAVKLKRQQSMAHCEKIIAFCIELSLCCEEKQAPLMSYLQHYNSDNVIHNDSDTSSSESCEMFHVSIMACIAMFATAHPPFITEIAYFLPYLHISPSQLNRHNMALAGHVLRILQSTALLQRTQLRHHCQPEHPQQSLFHDLSQVALRHSTDNVSLAVSCMATLVTHVSQDATPLFQLAKMCFMPLLTIAKAYAAEVQRVSSETHVSQVSQMSQITLDTAQRNMFRRCLTVLGALCLHLRQCRSHWESFACRDTPNNTITSQQQYVREEQAARCHLAEAPPLHPLRLYGACFSAATFALSLMKKNQTNNVHNNADHNIHKNPKRTATQRETLLGHDKINDNINDKSEEDDNLSLVAVTCLCHIFTGYPPLMDFARRINLLDDLFELPSVCPSVNTYKITTAFLKSLNEMLIEEENRLETKSLLQAMREAGVSLYNIETTTDNNNNNKSKTKNVKNNKLKNNNNDNNNNTEVGLTHDKGSKLSARDNVLGAGNSGVATQVDSTLGGFILHQYLSYLKQFLRNSYHVHLLSEQNALRHASLTLIGTLLRQGMINPAEVMADLAMMQGHCIDIPTLYNSETMTNNVHLTDNIAIANDALQILLLENERHPTFVEAKYLEGIELWFEVTWNRFSSTNKNDNNNDDNNDNNNEDVGPAVLFSHLFGNNNRNNPISLAEMFIPSFVKLFAQDRKKTLRILASLLEKCISKPANTTNTNTSNSVATPKQFQKLIYEHSVKHLVKVEFFSVLLAQWPYASAEEALFIISYIARNVSVEMTTSLNVLLPLLTQLGFTLTDTFDNNIRDNTNNNTKNNTNNNTNDINDSDINNKTQYKWEYTHVSFDLNHFLSHNTHHIDTSQRSFFLLWVQVYQQILSLRCNETLLRLKTFLKRLYQLSDERCQLYRVNDASAQYEKYHVSQWRDTSPVANCFFLPFSHSSLCVATQVEKESNKNESDVLKRKPLQYFQWKNHDAASMTRHIVPVALAVTRDCQRCHGLLFHEPNDVFYYDNTTHTINNNSINNDQNNHLYFDDNTHNNNFDNNKSGKSNRNNDVDPKNISNKDTGGHTHLKTPPRCHPKPHSKKRTSAAVATSRHASSNKKQKKKENYDSYEEDSDANDAFRGGANEAVLDQDNYFQDDNTDNNYNNSKRDGLRRRVNRVNYAAFDTKDEDDEDV